MRRCRVVSQQSYNPQEEQVKKNIMKYVGCGMYAEINCSLITVTSCYSLHCHRAWIVQSYSTRGAHMYSYLIHGSFDPRQSTPEMES